ncbi:MAG: S-methyl-5-thioribose-1-phosphate isomerase [Planctomycetota bacterium]
MNPSTRVPKTIEWLGGIDGWVAMIDQTRLPAKLVMLEVHDVETMWHAIQRLSVRGAPAIGIAAAMGAVLGVRNAGTTSIAEFLTELDRVCNYLATSRPTAVNLAWALRRMRCVAYEASRPSARAPNPAANDQAGIDSIKLILLDEAKRIRDEDAAMCRAIGTHGQHLVKEGCSVLTHCNAGSLATAEYGTALAPLYTAHELGRRFRVYADETRPLFQGSRLTAWELHHAGIEVTVLCDNAAAAMMQARKIDLVITGADRIAANGDTANKIGTYSLAVVARAHGIPFYVAAPSSTFDLSMPDGSAIPIEQRSPDEVGCPMGIPAIPAGVPCHNPAFDVTPADLITAIITERGVIQPVDSSTVAEHLS